MFYLCRMKSIASVPNFLCTYIMGRLVSKNEKEVVLEEACMIYESLVKVGDGATITNNFVSNDMVSNGFIPVRLEDTVFHREVKPDDPTLKGYKETFDGYRLERLNIKKPGHFDQRPAPGVV